MGDDTTHLDWQSRPGTVWMPPENDFIRERVTEALELVARIAPDAIDAAKVPDVARVVSWAITDLTLARKWVPPLTGL